MSAIESEARDRLLQRRQVLRCGQVESREGDLDSPWTDYEAAPEPISESVRQEIREIDAALGRIADGLYGTCLACGGPMGLQRLRALPEARYCLSCSDRGPVSG
ncbi:MAG TPA: TraR/DksA C4-type zinc finger protein [Anaeromyxobacteraceae bacterium]|nr:TraR/DksA C4-type zinc finger protein [Anaeromyxobacteraceae bacterium]